MTSSLSPFCRWVPQQLQEPAHPETGTHPAVQAGQDCSGHLCLRSTGRGGHPNSLALRPEGTMGKGSGMLLSAWLWPGEGRSALCSSVFYMVGGTQKKWVPLAEVTMVLILNFTNHLFSAAFFFFSFCWITCWQEECFCSSNTHSFWWQCKK